MTKSQRARQLWRDLLIATDGKPSRDDLALVICDFPCLSIEAGKILLATYPTKHNLLLVAIYVPSLRARIWPILSANINHDELAEIIKTIPTWKKRAWKKLLADNPSNSLCGRIICFYAPEFAYEAWQYIKNNKPSPDDVIPFLGVDYPFSTEAWAILSSMKNIPTIRLMDVIYS